MSSLIAQPSASLHPTRSAWPRVCRAVPIEVHLYAFVTSSSLLQALGLELFLTYCPGARYVASPALRIDSIPSSALSSTVVLT
jgi:hypothetical protein